jgi:hypothetical protein
VCVCVKEREHKFEEYFTRRDRGRVTHTYKFLGWKNMGEGITLTQLLRDCQVVKSNVIGIENYHTL